MVTYRYSLKNTFSCFKLIVILSLGCDGNIKYIDTDSYEISVDESQYVNNMNCKWIALYKPGFVSQIYILKSIYIMLVCR